MTRKSPRSVLMLQVLCASLLLAAGSVAGPVTVARGGDRRGAAGCVAPDHGYL
jgi:hypothetical protein